MRRVGLMVAAAITLLAVACGDGASGGDVGFEPAEGGEERTVLVDYRHGEFASAFLQYYPEQVKAAGARNRSTSCSVRWPRRPA